jgi:hypothetical protein
MISPSVDLNCSSEVVTRTEPINLVDGDRSLFQNELIKELPMTEAVPIRNALVSPGGQLFSGLRLNLN